MKSTLRSSVILYFVTTFVLSWSVFSTILFLRWPEFPTVIPGVWGPTLSALAVTAFLAGWPGVRKIVRRWFYFRAPFRVYVFLITGFAAIALLGQVIGNLVNGSAPGIETYFSGSLLGVVFFQFLIPGLGEEMGWRGFALHRLQHVLSPLAASLVVGIIHWCWHLPTYWLGSGMHNVPAIWSILYVLPWSILATWAYNHSRGSIWIAALFHSLHGVILTAIPVLPPSGDVPITTDLLTSVFLADGQLTFYLTTVVIYWILAIAVSMGAWGGLGTPPPLDDRSEAGYN